MNDRINDAMRKAIVTAQTTMREKIGGPFGAAILDRDGNLIAVASNTVLRDHDPTAHAEINAIRMAGQRFGTHDLKGCIMIATCYPCPMCLSAILWANIDTLVYGCDANDAAKIGFRDDFITNYIKNPDSHREMITMTQVNRDACLTLFEEYASSRFELY